MAANNTSYVPVQHPQHNLVQNAVNTQVCITYICNIPLLNHMSMQTLGGRDHELWSNEHPTSIDSDGPYATVNHLNALPSTRYTSTMGNEDPSHVAIVSVHFISLHAPFADGGCGEGP